MIWWLSNFILAFVFGRLVSVQVGVESACDGVFQASCALSSSLKLSCGSVGDSHPEVADHVEPQPIHCAVACFGAQRRRIPGYLVLNEPFPKAIPLILQDLMSVLKSFNSGRVCGWLQNGVPSLD